MISRKEIETQSARTGFSRGMIEKDYQLTRVLGLINGKKLPLVFKGGTALYKIYFQEPPRISVDLDFNSSTELSELSREIKGLLEPKGFTLKKQLLRKKKLLMLFQYESFTGAKDNVQVDVSTTPDFLNPVKIQLKSEFFDPFAVTVCPLEQIVAEKIHAFVKRGRGRDLFDLFFITRKKLDMPLLKKVVHEKFRYESDWFEADVFLDMIKKFPEEKFDEIKYFTSKHVDWSMEKMTAKCVRFYSRFL